MHMQILSSPKHLHTISTLETDGEVSPFYVLVEVGCLVAQVAAILALPPLFPILAHSLTHAELYYRIQAYEH